MQYPIIGSGERFTKESEVSRVIIHALSLLAFVAVGLLILWVEMALIGRLIGVVLAPGAWLLGTMFKRNESDGISNGWLAVFVVGVVLLVVAVIDQQAQIWPPLWWQLGNGKMWIAWGTSSDAVPAWLVMPRFMLAAALGAYYPIVILPGWRFTAEIMFPQLANVKFRPLTLEGLHVPFFGGLVEQLEEMVKMQQPVVYSERRIANVDPAEVSPTGAMASSPARGASRLVRIGSDIATEQQLETLAVGVLREGHNLSRNYWTSVGLFTDGGWRAFRDWLVAGRYAYRVGNLYKLRAVGRHWLAEYLPPTP
ncbi:MAG: hypothetical protein GY841_10195 [FCB group bacterium]|nr:hypothetical protein [FCB group bacterium]